jgi:glycosyltransferase involved in cell wall biosynthesis
MEKIILRAEILTNQAILIPCLNEGERLIKTIRNLENELGIDFDLILIDGGSTDGSIQQVIGTPLKILQSVLITNAGKGLSFDLHAGFKEVFNKYEYVMTLDGNNKDDVRNLRKIFDFALSGKIDFVQGSRFRRGGISQNLPLDRYIGIKLFISPIISIASRNIFTDPSNQCRIFSKKAIDLLIKVDISRFKRYDYFFFIPIKLSRSGYLTSEFPVTRSYPSDGTIPTHISKSRYLRIGLDIVRIAVTHKNF